MPGGYDGSVSGQVYRYRVDADATVRQNTLNQTSARLQIYTNNDLDNTAS